MKKAQVGRPATQPLDCAVTRLCRGRLLAQGRTGAAADQTLRGLPSFARNASSAIMIWYETGRAEKFQLSPLTSRKNSKRKDSFIMSPGINRQPAFMLSLSPWCLLFLQPSSSLTQ